MSAMDKLAAIQPDEWTEKMIIDAAKEERDAAFTGIPPVGTHLLDHFERGMRKGWVLGFEAAMLHLKNAKP